VFRETIFPFSAKEMHTDPSKDVYGSPLEVVDTFILDYETDALIDT